MRRFETVKKIDTNSWFCQVAYNIDLDNEQELPRVFFAEPRPNRRVCGGLREVIENSYIFLGSRHQAANPAAQARNAK